MFVKTLVSEPRPSIERGSSNGATGFSVLNAISVAPSSQHTEASLGPMLERYWPDRLFSWYG